MENKAEVSKTVVFEERGRPKTPSSVSVEIPDLALLGDLPTDNLPDNRKRNGDIVSIHASGVDPDSAGKSKVACVAVDLFTNSAIVIGLDYLFGRLSKATGMACARSLLLLVEEHAARGYASSVPLLRSLQGRGTVPTLDTSASHDFLEVRGDHGGVFDA